MNYGFRKDSQNIAGCGHLRGTCGPLMKMPNWKFTKKTILDNWFPISQVTARTYQHNEKLPQTQSEQEPQSAYIANISQLQSLEFTHPSVCWRTSLSRSALRYLGWKYRRSRDHNLGFSWTFRCFRTEVLHSSGCWGFSAPNIQFAYADFYTVSLCVFDFGCCKQSRSQSMRKEHWKSSKVRKFAKKKSVKSKNIGW